MHTLCSLLEPRRKSGVAYSLKGLTEGTSTLVRTVSCPRRASTRDDTQNNKEISLYPVPDGSEGGTSTTGTQDRSP